MIPRFQELLILHILSLLLLTSGCASPIKNNFSHIRIGEVHPKVYMDPNVDFSKYLKFTLFRFAQTDDGAGINAIEESQLLFVASNVLSGMGYEYVATREEADIVIGLRYTNEYKSQYVPPRQMTLPFYVGGGTSTTYSNYSGYIDNTYGSVSGTSTTQQPGYWTTQTYTVPGRTVGYYYPSISIEIVDADSTKTIWSGAAVSMSTTPDVRLTGQFLVLQILGNQLPQRQRPARNKGLVGISAMPLSTDGNRYFPTVLQVADKSPAKSAGLRPFDQIIAVDGIGTDNITIKDFFDLIGEPGESTEFTIRRLKQNLQKKIRLGHR